MKHKLYPAALSGLFCGFLAVIFLGSAILPDRSFSQLENRYLAKVPEFSLENLKDGTFMEQAEDYTADHILGRDLWVAMKAWCERLSGKQENNGAYLADKETLINRVEEPDGAKLEESMGYVNALVANVDVPVHFGIIPSSAAVWADRLPAGAPTADELGWIEKLYAMSDARNLDMAGALMEHREEDIFYRTDHHWTSLGAFYGANALFEAMGLDQLDLAHYPPIVLSDAFYGTTFSSSGVRWVSPDVITAYIPEGEVEVTSYFTGSPQEGELYVEKFLGEKDKYSAFLGGNQPLCVLENPSVDGPNVLVIRDSYSDCLAPILTEGFSQVHLFDVRYNMMSIKDYVTANHIDQVVVLYSFNNFAQGQNLFFLGR